MSGKGGIVSLLIYNTLLLMIFQEEVGGENWELGPIKCVSSNMKISLCKSVFSWQARLGLLLLCLLLYNIFLCAYHWYPCCCKLWPNKIWMFLKCLLLCLGYKGFRSQNLRVQTGRSSVCMSCNCVNDFAATLQGVPRSWSPLQMTGFG